MPSKTYRMRPAQKSSQMRWQVSYGWKRRQEKERVKAAEVLTQKYSLIEEVQWADQCLTISFDKHLVVWVRPTSKTTTTIKKHTDALRGQQAHSDGSGGIPFIGQTARSCVPNVGLYVPDTTRHLPGWGHWWESEHHPIHQSPSNHTETPSQVLPRKASVWTLPFYWMCYA